MKYSILRAVREDAGGFVFPGVKIVQDYLVQEFDFIIDATPEDFGDWLVSKSNELFREPKNLPDEGVSIQIHNPRLESAGENSIERFE